MAKYLKTSNIPKKKTSTSPVLRKMKKSIYWQAGLALMTVILTIIIVFTMTAAWYTNIVQTSGLVFEAESWGFDGNVSVQTDSVVAAPGDEGIVSLEVENANDGMAAVSVSVSKSRLSEDPYTRQQMQKRLYFYIDTEMTRNDENMERVYLNSMESYTYTLFTEGGLVLSEQLHNDAQLKWQWVYDVLGYYVLGTYSDATDVAVLEYLRPIEYNYNDATTTFDGVYNTLSTVDGTTTIDEFLVELSKTDGYAGEIDVEQKTPMGFYPVDVDENGYGVYAYLSNYAEIEMDTAYDTELAAKAAQAKADNVAPESYLIQLNIAAQKNDENVLPVNTLQGLRTAMELGTTITIQLTEDIIIPDGEVLEIPEGSRFMLDLNGRQIICESANEAILVQTGSSLTMVNGGITGTGKQGLQAIGAEVILNNVYIGGFDYGIFINDKYTDKQADYVNDSDSRIRLVDCTMDSAVCTVYVTGNGEASARKTQLVIDGCDLTGEGFVLCGNGTYWGTDVQIMDSKLVSAVEGVTAGIYHPQRDSTLTIYNSEISGYTGIALKGGDAAVYGSAIAGLGEAKEPSFSGSGYSDTGAGIYIETNYDWNISLLIDGFTEVNENGESRFVNSALSSVHGKSLHVYKDDAKNVTVTIAAGIFQEEQPEAYIAPESQQTFKDGLWTVKMKKVSQ